MKPHRAASLLTPSILLHICVVNLTVIVVDCFCSLNGVRLPSAPKLFISHPMPTCRQATVNERPSPSSLFMSASLAGPFLVHFDDKTDIKNLSWSLFALEDMVELDAATRPTDDVRAWVALNDCDALIPATTSPKMSLNAVMSSGRLEISVLTNDPSNNGGTGCDVPLIKVLSRIFLQWILARQPHLLTGEVTTGLPFDNGATVEGSEIQDLSIKSATDNELLACRRDTLIRRLFEALEGVSPTSELVEMVDRHGHALGIVPRPLVHQFNLLHRGIGVLITKDVSIESTTRSQQQPDLYCHRRTATKRIFPSLYDMFVGGISLAGEPSPLTARREVAEELGLTDNDVQAMEEPENPSCSRLSHRLLQCVVCTSYNRCVVDVFGYTMDTATERIQWQAEEVAWGAFMPYHIVEAAADRSIQRLVDKDTWPGRYPPIQSRQKGSLEASLDSDTGSSGNDWREWDFVPDGLLVWEAWLLQVQAKE